MRHVIWIAAACAVLPSCAWSEFDDVANTTWVGSTTKPSGEGAADYGVAIVNASPDAIGGKLAVLGNDKPSYSTLDYEASGKSSAGPNQASLGIHFIVALGDAPLFLSDPLSNKIAIVAAAIDAGNIAVVGGAPDTISDQTFQAQPPQAATYANSNVVIVAGDPVATNGTNIYTVNASPPTKCPVVDDVAMPVSATAIASDGAYLWVWSKSGALLGYLQTTVLAGCVTPKAPDVVIAAGFVAGSGAKVHIVGSSSGAFDVAVLIAHGDHVTTGEVIVVDLVTHAIVGLPLMIDGIRSSAVGKLGDTTTGSTYVVLGLADRAVDGVKAGQVELHVLDTATGMITAQHDSLYNDAQPEDLELFGRSVAIMKFNDKNILAVAASNEIFAYFEAAQYPETRMK